MKNFVSLRRVFLALLPAIVAAGLLISCSNDDEEEETIVSVKYEVEVQPDLLTFYDMTVASSNIAGSLIWRENMSQATWEYYEEKVGDQPINFRLILTGVLKDELPEITQDNYNFSCYYRITWRTADGEERIASGKQDLLFTKYSVGPYLVNHPAIELIRYPENVR